jgi:hypothetical protein
MTIIEDPHDNWATGFVAGEERKHAMRAQFWLVTLGGLTVFWSAVAWAVLHVVL